MQYWHLYENKYFRHYTVFKSLTVQIKSLNSICTERVGLDLKLTFRTKQTFLTTFTWPYFGNKTLEPTTWCRICLAWYHQNWTFWALTEVQSCINAKEDLVTIFHPKIAAFKSEHLGAMRLQTNRHAPHYGLKLTTPHLLVWGY